MQNPQRAPEQAPGLSKADLAAIERDAQYVNPEQIMAAAFFAKQLQADITGIKRAAVGEGLKVSNVDMSKVMPSNILKTHRPVGMPGMPAPQPRPPVMPAPLEVPVPVQEAAIPEQPLQSLWTEQPVRSEPTNQLELDFDKKARYIEVVEAIERLEKSIVSLTEKVNEIYLLVEKKDKKKLKKPLIDGTQTG